MGNSSSSTKDENEAATLGSVLLGRPPVDWDDSKSYVIHSAISDTVLENIEPVGPQYLAHARRKLLNRTFSEDEEHLARSAAEAAAAAQEAQEAEDDNFEIEPDHKDDLRRDAKDWKTQDHYRMLGLGKIRWRATRGMIKKAHRTKVLVHHPDKKAGASGGSSSHDDAFFKCLQKSYEILSDPLKRRQYDSVDNIPEDAYNPLKDGAHLPFIEAWRPVFEREIRFSVKDRHSAPTIGTMESTKAEVEAFYGFWYNFESWRSFEYLDKDEGEGAENRDDKRYIEKKNKAERAKLKKEDTARLRKLVDTAFSLDPRMAAFKEQEKENKEAKKKERLEKEKKSRLEAEREAILAKEREEERESEARIKREEEKKEKEAKKKAIRKEKRMIKTLVKEANYFYAKGSTIAPSTLEIFLSELESMLDKLSLEELEKIVADLSAPKTTIEAKKKKMFSVAQKLVRDGLAEPESLTQFGADNIERPKDSKQQATSANSSTQAQGASSSSTSANVPTKEWSVEEVALLIKAANKFPGGVSNRWETIAAYVALHTGLPQRDPEDVIKKSKAVQKGTSQEATVRQLQFQKKTMEITDAPSVRYDIEGEVPPVVATPASNADAAKNPVNKKKASGSSTSAAKGSRPASTSGSATSPTSQKPLTPTVTTESNQATSPTTPKSAALAAALGATPAAAPPAASLWTAAEQKSLESGLKAFPPSWQGEGDRWDKIAECVPGRTKKECKLRVK
ncbi:hypothetical protein BGZ94_004528, partial [Podila epigama]